MRNSLCKKICGDFAWVVSVAFASIVVMACSSSDDKSVAGGTTEDAGIVAIKNLDVAGVTQKGPFVKGSAVTVQGIDCKTLQLTDELFEGSVKSDKGDFTVKNVSLKSTCALFEVTGVYRSEITGKKSSKELTLRALTDLKDRENVNINVLTELEYERLLHLVTEKGKTFAEAKSQAEQEVLAAFDIAGSFEEFENLNIFESGDGNAALLAVSVMMQVKTDDAGLVKRMNEFVDSFAETGMWKDSSAKASIADWAADAIAGNGLDSIRKNIEAWDIGDTVAAFEKFIAAEFPDTVILSSDSQSSSSATLSEVEGSSSSEVTADTTFSSLITLAGPCKTKTEDHCEYGELVDDRDGQTYKTVKIGDLVWMAENLNYESDESTCYNKDSTKCSMYGRFYAWSVAMTVCPEGWHLPDTTEWNILFSAVGGQSTASKALKSQIGWHDNGDDAFGFTALPAGTGDDMESFGGEGDYTMIWSSTGFSSYVAYLVMLNGYAEEASLTRVSKVDLSSVRCVMDNGLVSPSSSSVEDSASTFDWSVPKEAYFNPAINYDSIVDVRDGKVYKTVKIGNQVWMAENLNYATKDSWCYDNEDAHCDVTGRLYTWFAAIDSASLTKADTLNVHGICPAGWHLPDYDEWDTLFAAVGGISVAGSALKASAGWVDDGNGLNSSGFTVIPAGQGAYDVFGSIGEHTAFWSALRCGEIAAYDVFFSYRSGKNGDGVSFGSTPKDAYQYVRCVKD